MFSLTHMYFWLHETKGKTPSEIEALFASSKVNYTKPARESDSVIAMSDRKNLEIN